MKLSDRENSPVEEPTKRYRRTEKGNIEHIDIAKKLWTGNEIVQTFEESTPNKIEKVGSEEVESKEKKSVPWWFKEEMQYMDIFSKIYSLWNSDVWKNYYRDQNKWIISTENYYLQSGWLLGWDNENYQFYSKDTESWIYPINQKQANIINDHIRNQIKWDFKNYLSNIAFSQIDNIITYLDQEENTYMHGYNQDNPPQLEKHMSINHIKSIIVKFLNDKYHLIEDDWYYTITKKDNKWIIPYGMDTFQPNGGIKITNYQIEIENWIASKYLIYNDQKTLIQTYHLSE